jgi:hypothetical protein
MKVDWKKYSNSIPDKIQIGPRSHYDILWTENFNGQPWCGTTVFDPKQITIKMGMTPKLTVTTYLHELLHAISEENDVKLTENQVLACEKALYYVLKQNNIFKFKKGKTNEKRKRTRTSRRRVR